MNLLEKIRTHLPQRRRRFWRYVSPRRRGLGLLALTLLLLLMYGYWYMTNDRQVRQMAEGYIEQLSGGHAKIGRAHFSLFGGVVLHDVRVSPGGSTPGAPFFQAESIVIRHNPWKMFLKGALQPTEILCVRPEVTLEQESDVNTGKVSVTFRRGMVSGASVPELPPVRVRSGKLRLIEIRSGQRKKEDEMDLNVSMLPQGAGLYRIIFEQEREKGEAVIEGSLTLDMRTGDITALSGIVPMVRLPMVLPPEYRPWVERFDLKGKFDIKGRTSLGSGPSTLEAELADVALRLPPEEGNLELVRVRGRIGFVDNNVFLRDITGRIPQAGNAEFRLSGKYEGLEASSPFEIQIGIKGMTLPSPAKTGGPLAATLKEIQDACKIEGKLNLETTFRRLPTGKVLSDGKVEPLGATLTLAGFPCTLEDVTGEVEFQNSGRVHVRKLRARRGAGRLEVNGQARYAGANEYNLTILAEDLVLEAQLVKALPPDIQEVFRQLNLGGSLSSEVQLAKNAQQDKPVADTLLVMNGKTELSHCMFPYPMRNIRGKVRIAGGTAEIVEPLRGENGPVRATATGKVGRIEDATPDVDIRIVATDVGLDETLLKAVGPGGAKLLRSLHATGSAKRVHADLMQAKGRDLSYKIVANLQDVALKADPFPYALQGAGGAVTITPETIGIEQLAGVHGKSPVTVRGTIFLAGKEPGVKLEVSARNVVVDRELFEALPKGAQHVWRRLSPSGLADVKLEYLDNAPSKPGVIDYTVHLAAADLSLRYEKFPFPFTGIRGTAVATPGKIVLDKLTSTAGAATTAVSGTILSDASSDTADLVVSARNLPINAEMLAALPDDLGLLTSHFKTGGTLDLDFKKLHLKRTEPPATQSASAPASRPQAQATWSVEGSASLKEGVLDLGMGPRTFSGGLSGRGEQDGGLKVDARVALDRIVLEKQKITDIQGRVQKSGSNTLVRVEELTAKAHGGQVAGFAEFRLGKDVQYNVSLSMENLRMDKIFEAEGDAKAVSEIKGLLDGNIQLMGSGNDVATRQAVGVIWLHKAKLYRVPVMLGLLNIIYLAVPGETAFNEGELHYHLKGNTLVLREIVLSGPGASMLGSGSVDLKDGSLNLTFLTGPPGKLTGIRSVASEILRGIISELGEVRITGTITKPEMRTVPLRSLDATIRTMLEPSLKLQQESGKH